MALLDALGMLTKVHRSDHSGASLGGDGAEFALLASAEVVGIANLRARSPY